MARCYYETLGVARDSDGKTIKSAFRKLAMECHPDRNPGDAESEKRFKEASAAYEILSDEQKRAAYDRYGHAAFQNGGGGANGFHGFGGGRGDFNASAFADVFDDIFGEFMGGGRGRGAGRGAGRGSDLKYDLEISLKDAFAGKKATINVPGSVACDTCEGSGAKPGSGPTTCGTCNGAGRVRASQGLFVIERTCPSCGGRGQVISDPCTDCGGQGRVRKERTLAVDIPAGVEDGMRMRLPGEGEAGARGGPPGDLYVFISVKPHDLFERDGADLYCSAPVPMTTAALGGEIEAPTIDGGRVKIKIPEGAQTGKRFRIRGKGMSVLKRQQRGDLFVELLVETPQRLNARQKELLREFCEVGGCDDCPQSKNFFQRAKDFWENVTDQN